MLLSIYHFHVQDNNLFSTLILQTATKHSHFGDYDFQAIDYYFHVGGYVLPCIFNFADCYQSFSLWRLCITKHLFITGTLETMYYQALVYHSHL